MTMQADDVQTLLQSHLPDCTVIVRSDGGRFDITAIGQSFAGLSAVKRQQLVYQALNPYIADGSIHAVTMQTYTQEEYERLR